MRRLGLLLAGLVSPLVFAQIQPEVVGKSVMAPPTASWFLVRDSLGPMYIFDAANAEMQGLLSISSFTPAVEVNLKAGEIYAAESYYSRGTRGERTDVVTIYDMANLAPKAEIKVPNKIAALPFRQYIGLLDDERHLAVFNMTPAQSVTVVDIAQGSFIGELSTPGCALIMPSAQRSFLQICGDGTLQLIGLGKNGKETQRLRSRAFFDIKQDPVFDKPLRTSTGWLLTSYMGKVFDVAVTQQEISLSQPWSMLTEEDFAAGWRPGGGQFVTYHEGLDLLFVLMNPGGEYAHDHAGTEVWIYERGRQQRVARLAIEYGGTDVYVTKDAAPLLVVSGEDTQVHIYDVATLTEQRVIEEIGRWPGYLQGF